MQQLTILDAIASQERAFQRIQRAECYDDWKPIAEAFLVQYAHEMRGCEFSGEDATDSFLERGLMLPGDMRWFGPVFKSALKRGVMHRIVGRTAPRRQGHGTLGASIYMSGPA
jgi:hypothetical protein